MHVPANKPGPYVVRAVVRDAATGNTGSVQQFVEAPDIADGHMVLSGLVLLELAANAPTSYDASLSAARRSFRRGAVLQFGYEVVNVAHPGLDAETRVFHNGQLVTSGKTQLTPDAATPQRLSGSGRLPLGADMGPGEYVLQVIVSDKLAKGKFGTVTQLTDFAIEPEAGPRRCDISVMIGAIARVASDNLPNNPDLTSGGYWPDARIINPAKEVPLDQAFAKGPKTPLNSGDNHNRGAEGLPLRGTTWPSYQSA